MKKLMFIAISVVLCFSDDKINMQNYLDENSTNTGEKKNFVYEFTDGIQYDRPDNYYNYMETIYAYIENNRNDSPTIELDAKEIKKDAIFDVVKANNDLIAKREKEKNALLEEESKEKNRPIFAQGYCKFNNDVEITTMSEYSYLECYFNDIGRSTLAVLLVPDFYSQAVVAQPLYISYSDSYGNEKRLNTTNGAILNATRTSINIANIKNDYMLEKILASTAYKAATITTRQASAYLEDKKNSRTNEQINYVNTGDGTMEAVRTTNTEKPNKSDYVTGAVIELVSGFVEILGKSVLSNIKYYFKINKNSQVFADIVVSPIESLNNHGGIIKKETLTNKHDNILNNGEYNFIPNDAGFKIEVEKTSGGNQQTSGGNQ